MAHEAKNKKRRPHNVRRTSTVDDAKGNNFVTYPCLCKGSSHDVPRTPAADEAKGNKAVTQTLFVPGCSHASARTPRADKTKDNKDKTSLQSVAMRLASQD